MDFKFNKIKKRLHYWLLSMFILFTSSANDIDAQLLPGFKTINIYNEQEFSSENFVKDVHISINAPQYLNKNGKTYLVLFALPNGNSIEWTKGRRIKRGDDWHFDIQHIAAQTRFVRNLDKKNNYIVAYLMAAQKSWPGWKRTTPDSKRIIKNIIDSINGMFSAYDPQIILNGHSGGGSFIFGYLDIVDKIPSNVERIAFLDSDYGYEDSLHTTKIVDWLTENKKANLVVLAYNVQPGDLQWKTIGKSDRRYMVSKQVDAKKTFRKISVHYQHRYILYFTYCFKGPGKNYFKGKSRRLDLSHGAG